MPPKKALTKKEQQKVVEDKLFGMKNKKGKKAQEIAKSTQNSLQSSKQAKRQEEIAAERRAEREKRKVLEAEQAILFRSANQKKQVCPPGTDPKSILCINFKAGHCTYGDACNFSHDLNVENKSQKRDMYTDMRDLKTEEEKNAGTIEDWDEETLQSVINKKGVGQQPNPTTKICKFFLKAIETKKYGWFWECPAGGDKCQYRHALPQGYVFQSTKKKEKVETRPLEEILEEKRALLPSTGLTPVTEESFAVWRDKIKAQKAEKAAELEKERQKKIAVGQARLTGRELLSQDPSKWEDAEQDDIGDFDLSEYLKQKKEEDERLDQENAKLAEEFNKEGISLAPIISSPPPNIEKNGEPKQVPSETVLEGVDTTLFEDDGIEDIEEEDLEDPSDDETEQITDEKGEKDENGKDEKGEKDDKD